MSRLSLCPLLNCCSPSNLSCRIQLCHSLLNPVIPPSTAGAAVQFYVDFMGKLSDDRVQNAMRHLQESAPFVRVLGSFPMDTDLGATNVEQMFSEWNTTTPS